MKTFVWLWCLAFFVKWVEFVLLSPLSLAEVCWCLVTLVGLPVAAAHLDVWIAVWWCYLYFFKSPVHVVLVSLLVDQLSSLFLTFFGRQKKILFSLREFLVSLWTFFGQALIFWYTKKKFGIPKRNLVDQKNQRLTKNSLRLNKFFFGRPKKGRNRLDNWSTKRLTKTTWTGLMSGLQKLDITILKNRVPQNSKISKNWQ